MIKVDIWDKIVSVTIHQHGIRWDSSSSRIGRLVYVVWNMN